MAPAPSRSPLDRLIGDLQSDDSVRRDAAVARLRVLGARAVPRLAAFIESTAPAHLRARAISALEGATDPRVMTLALSCLESEDRDVVIAALGLLRPWVAQETGTRLLEVITSLAVDRTRDPRIRAAAVDALSDLPDPLVEPIRAQAPPPESTGPSLDDAAAAAEWMAAHGHRATLSSLHDAIVAFRDRERTVETRRERAGWLAARGAAHRVLADRGSRLALYDAKEALTSARGPLPEGFLDALTKVAEDDGLEILARAWSSSQDVSWRMELTAAARGIISRLRLTGRNASVKNVRAHWPGFL